MLRKFNDVIMYSMKRNNRITIYDSAFSTTKTLIHKNSFVVGELKCFAIESSRFKSKANILEYYYVTVLVNIQANDIQTNNHNVTAIKLNSTSFALNKIKFHPSQKA